jgi:TonB family protein
MIFDWFVLAGRLSEFSRHFALAFTNKFLTRIGGLRVPLNIRRIFASVFLALFGTIVIISAQVPQASPTTPVQSPITSVDKQPTSAEVMRERISKAKAYIAVRNYNAAIYELENIRRETSDTSVNAVTNVLLMNSYLEQGDYKRAQDFLNEFFKSYKSNSARGNLYYAAVAAQVIKGARNQVERYRALGLSVSDRNLPLEAVNDIERMRETLELVVTQAKELGADIAKSAAAMALLEEATNSRSMIARDDYDARRWRNELGDSREQIANSRSVIINAVDGTTVSNSVPQEIVATNAPSGGSSISTVFNPVNTNSGTQAKPSDSLVAANNTPAIDLPKPNVSGPVNEPQQNSTLLVAESKPDASAATTGAASSGPMDVGSLISYATKQQAPIYPPAAKSMRTSGVVKVEVTVNESGEVAEVQKTTGPIMLQTAAKDAIRKWKFRPFVRDGQPVRAIGFVNFNFSL